MPLKGIETDDGATILDNDEMNKILAENYN